MTTGAMRLGVVMLGGMVVLGLSALLTYPVPASAHDYVGEGQCESCHDAKHEALKSIIGPHGTFMDPVSVWMQDPHHKAYDSLTSAWGKVAAAKVKVADPQAPGSMCLSCHATGANSDSAPDPSEGVSCEACHGAAADWIKKSVHGEIDDSPAKMATAVAAGMLDLRKIDVRTQNCRTCHVVDHSKRPCYRSSEKPFNVHNDKKFRHWRNNIPAI